MSEATEIYKIFINAQVLQVITKYNCDRKEKGEITSVWVLPRVRSEGKGWKRSKKKKVVFVNAWRPVPLDQIIFFDADQIISIMK